MNFFQVQIMAPNQADYAMWKGFTEANLRNVIMFLEREREAYLDKAHPCQRNFMKVRRPGPVTHLSLSLARLPVLLF